MLPSSQSIDFFTLHEDENFQQEIEELDRLSGVSLNERYGLKGDDPYEAFEVFRFRFGVEKKWVPYKAWQVSVKQGVDQEEVEQHLWLKAWLAATDPRYNPECGKSIIGWIHQRVQWSFINLIKTKNPMQLLEDFRTDNSSLEPEDKCCCSSSIEDSTSLMAGSYSLSRYHKRSEAVNLIQRILKVADELPYDFRAPIKQLLDPSDHFLEFVEKEDETNSYEGAARFEICSSSALFGFTGSTAFNLKVAIEFICRKIPELRELRF